MGAIKWERLSRIRAHYGRPGFCGATRRAEFVSAGSVAG